MEQLVNIATRNAQPIGLHFKAAMPVAFEEEPLHKVLTPDQAQLKVMDATDDSPGGWLEGYASVFGNVDSGGDVVEKGAFTKTIKERLKKGYIKLVDSHMVFSPFGGGTKSIIGVVTEAKEDDFGLWFRAKISTVADAQDIRTKVKEGILTALSFGYDIVKSAPDKVDAMVQHLNELKLYEVSVVPWGMNELAHLTTVKSVVPISGFGLAEKGHVWDAEAAKSRWQNYISTKDPSDWEDEQWNRYKKGFLWYDPSSADTMGAYKFAVVDVIDGTPKYVLKAAASALGHVRKGGGAWEKDNGGLESHIKKLYTKFDELFPIKGTATEPEPVASPELDTLIAGMKSHAGLDPADNLISGMKSLVKDMGMGMTTDDEDDDAAEAATMPPNYQMVALDAAKRCETCASWNRCCDNGVNGGCDYYNCFVMKNGICDAFNFPTGDPDAGE